MEEHPCDPYESCKYHVGHVMNDMTLLLWSNVRSVCETQRSFKRNFVLSWSKGMIQISAIPFHAKIHVVVQVAVFQSMGGVCQFLCASCTEYLPMHAFTSCN